MSERVLVITGSRKGIGRHRAERALERGAMVVGCSRSASELRHANYRHFELDVADESAVKELFSAVRKEFGRLDGLINNAGIASMNHFLLTPLSTAQQIMSTNYLGTFLFCREAAKLMQRRKQGRIVNFTTVAVPLALAGEAAYAASKAAVISLTQVLARELAPFEITVNAVGPTPIDTDLIRHVPADKLEKLMQQQAIPRLGTLDDVANVVDFFLHPGSGFITGQVIYLGGVGT